MSYSTARAKIVSIIEAITPTDTSVFQTRFQHMPNAQGRNVTSRSFWLEASVDGQSVIRGPDLIDLTTPMHVVTMTLTVTYRDPGTRQHETDIALEADRTDISTALLDPTGWAYATSGIMNVANGRDFMPTRRRHTGHATEMQIVFPLTYR